MTLIFELKYDTLNQIKNCVVSAEDKWQTPEFN